MMLVTSDSVTVCPCIFFIPHDRNRQDPMVRKLSVSATQIRQADTPTAANVSDKDWLHVVVDGATDPKLFRVQDPIRPAFKTRQSFTLNSSLGSVNKHQA
jgi:hypothetical protein